MPSQQTHPVGFNNQISYDPFFPSNDSEENLLPVLSDYSSVPQSFYSPTPERSQNPSEGRSTRSPSAPQRDLTPNKVPLNGYHGSSSPNSNAEFDSGNDDYDFLSPNPYRSENDYSVSSEHTATPENAGFYLEDHFGALDQARQSHFQDLSSNQDNSASAYTRSNLIHRLSSGAATKASSHLMSPVLTDPAGTSTRDGTSTPPTVGVQVKEEPIHNIHMNTIHQIGQHEHFQRTPPTTDSSKTTSPNMPSSIPDIARAASPVIRVDQYARGDSPARQINQDSHVKRRHRGSFSSHLSVHDEPDDAEGDEERFNDRRPLDPIARSNLRGAPVQNLKDQEDAASRALKNADVEDWLDHSAPVSDAEDGLPPMRPREIGRRRRAKSAGAQKLSHANLESLETTPVDTHIPGPGVLVDESSGEEDDSDSGPPSIDDSPIPTPTKGMNELPGEARPGVYDELPNQPSLYRATLWQDSIHDSSDPGVKMQPMSSNEAIVRFQQRAADVETMSRVATWGTRRRSESDLHSLFRCFTLNSEKDDGPETSDKKKRDRSGSILHRLVPKRNATLKRKESEKAKQATATRPTVGDHSRTDSGDSRHGSLAVPRSTPAGLKRMGSLGKRPRSPRIDTGSAVAAMAGQIASMGSSGPLSATGVSSPPGQRGNHKAAMKRSASRSELNNGLSLATVTNDPGIADLLTKQGGPPMPTLAAPKTEDLDHTVGFEEDEEDETLEDEGITMDLSIKADPIVPTLEGFRINIRHLNPRLPPFMFDRVAQEQLRRYKKLLDFKVKHVQAISSGKCSSGKHCTELGGEPTYLPSKLTREPEMSQAGFSVSGIGPSEDDVNALAEGFVTPAQFPPGVPMPPVKRLPAEFECSLCFRVKKFNKPSDWSKHVHEDVQPFTCTFPTCAEPKSFKRKADWVRHENERHRQLEWWQCNINECTHRCYRKDNFVQHLVREHKLPEPKYKTVKAGKPAVRGPSAHKAKFPKPSSVRDGEPQNETDQVWKMVEDCRHETRKNPREEACKFCGNICNSWKKLTVHLAKHMEQVSMPVLSIVKQKDVTPETIISPIEQSRITSQPTSMSPISQGGPQSPFHAPGVVTDNMPAGFAPLASQSNYQLEGHYQRASPSTYPPPARQQQLAAAYAQGRETIPTIPDYGHYGASAPSFNPMSTPRAYDSQPTSSPSEMYSVQALSSQHRSSPYQDRAAFRYSPQHEPPYANNSAENSAFQFGGALPASLQDPSNPPRTYAQPNPSSNMYSQQIRHMNTAAADPNFQQSQAQQHFQGHIGTPNIGYSIDQIQGLTTTTSDSGMNVYGQPMVNGTFGYR
ncbi:uncharacterized protein KY384_004213 [Bacidia gigantensis]|uniref:uncharacterized protein n=1 Tax=Bacidia gigantensis TaxID=2732470 RepID=UPI001D05C07E|nr:uncharacterized protein KY384_004213 [Bacidia gigantensis]KAG8530856.1 hypothetical protein KY384_004213 [Bacidia gigantensis]